jgi:hypothetical protein
MTVVPSRRLRNSSAAAEIRTAVLMSSLRKDLAATPIAVSFLYLDSTTTPSASNLVLKVKMGSQSNPT